MFVASYEYRISKKDFGKWKRITKTAKKIYSDHGGGRSISLVRKEKNLIKIIELDFYNSKKDFISTRKAVGRDERIAGLFTEFLKIVRGKKIIREEFASDEALKTFHS